MQYHNNAKTNIRQRQAIQGGKVNTQSPIS